MTDQREKEARMVIATIRNQKNSNEAVDIVYLPSFNSFITEGIYAIFGQKEILIPVYMVLKDLDLVGAIVSTILEDMSLSRENGENFRFVEHFELMGKNYKIEEKELWVELMEQREDFAYI
jgi:hypothetical protein